MSIHAYVSMWAHLCIVYVEATDKYQVPSSIALHFVLEGESLPESVQQSGIALPPTPSYLDYSYAAAPLFTWVYGI